MRNPQPRLFFAFPDGVLHYVCAECTALCCKGHGWGGSLERHVRSLFVLYPALEATVAVRRGDIVDMTTPVTGCHFLEPDNTCGIETRHGRSAKPGVCSLFPFNLLRRIGSTVVVSPHFLCPIRLVLPADPDRVEGSYAKLASAVDESGLVGLDGLGSHIAMVPTRIGESPGRVVAREIEFRDGCAASIGHSPFRDVIDSFACEPKTLRRDVEILGDLCGLSHVKLPIRPDRLDANLLAIAPSLRLDFLRLSPDAVLRALALTELFVRAESALSDRMDGIQATFRSAQDRRIVVQLLAHGDEPLRLRRALPAKAPTVYDPALTFAAFTAMRGLANGVGVAAALNGAFRPEMSSGDRVALLMHMGTLADPLISSRRDGAN